MPAPSELFHSNSVLSSRTPHVIQSPFAKRNNNNQQNSSNDNSNNNNNANSHQSYSFESFNVFNDYTEDDELLPYEQAVPEPIRPGPSFDGLVAPPGPDGTISRSAYGTPIARRSPLVLWSPSAEETSSGYAFSGYGNGNVYGGYPGAGAIGGTILGNGRVRERIGNSGNGLSSKAISEHQYARWYYIATLRTFGYDYIKPPGLNKTLKTLLEEEDQNEMGEVSMDGMIDPATLGVELEEPAADVGTEGQEMTEEVQATVDGEDEQGQGQPQDEDQDQEESGRPDTQEDAEDLDAEIQEAEEFNYSDSEDEYDDSEYAGPLVVDDTYQIDSDARDSAQDEAGDQTPAQRRSTQAVPSTSGLARGQAARNQGYEEANTSLRLSLGWSTVDESLNMPSMGNLTTSSGGHLHSRLETMTVGEGHEPRSQGSRPSLTSIPSLGPPHQNTRNSFSSHYGEPATTPSHDSNHQEDQRAVHSHSQGRQSRSGIITPPPLFAMAANSAAQARSAQGNSSLFPQTAGGVPSPSSASGTANSRRSSNRFESEYPVSGTGASEMAGSTSKDLRLDRRYSRMFVPVTVNDNDSESEMSVDEM